MRTLIFGAGAVGGYLGAILAANGADVTLVARGRQYDALASRGVLLEGPRSGRPKPIRVRACRPGEEKPPYDLVCVMLKAHQIEPVARHIAGLVAKDGVLLFPQNGLPWWYFDALDSPRRGTRLATLDPEGNLARHIPIERVVGGVIFKPSDLVAPGRIRLADSAEDRLSIGEPDNRLTPRLQAIAEFISAAGWPVVVSEDIRKVKWSKLLSNAVWNPMGAITQCSAKDLATLPGTRDVAIAVIGEVMRVAASVGVKLDGDPATIVAGVAQRVAMLSSTLQDVRAGRSLELDALVNAIVEIGRLTGVATPVLSVVGACAAAVNARIVEDKVAIAPRPLAG